MCPVNLDAQYADDSRLAARQAIYRWRRPRLDLPALVADELDGGTVLDVGCGNGGYVRTLRARGLRVVAADRSYGMLAGVDHPLRLVADAARLPFRDGAFDAALAMHMLYHVSPASAAIGELRRVVRPGGVVIAATNSREDKRELDLLLGRPLDHNAFPLENAAEKFAPFFGDVRVRELRGEVVVPEPEPVLRFLASLGTDTAALERARGLVSAEIERTGAFRLTSATGYVVAR